MADPIEVIARSIARALHGSASNDLDDVARDVLTALEAEGMAVVPFEPTTEMKEVGFSTSADAIRSNRLGLDPPLNPPVEAYKVMLAARPRWRASGAR